MSIVAVHGPNTFGASGAGGAGTGQVTTAPQVKATADMANGQRFAFEATDKTRVAADYDWTFPGGTPATATDNKGPITVTYASGGSKTATLTVAAGAGPPAGGTYPITVTATATAAPRSVQGSEEEPTTIEEEIAAPDKPGVPDAPNEPDAPDVIEPEEIPPEALPDEEVIDPGDYTVAQVIGYAEEYPEDIPVLIEYERAGKNRSTLINQLEAMQAA